MILGVPGPLSPAILMDTGGAPGSFSPGLDNWFMDTNTHVEEDEDMECEEGEEEELLPAVASFPTPIAVSLLVWRFPWNACCPPGGLACSPALPGGLACSPALPGGLACSPALPRIWLVVPPSLEV